MSRPPGAERPPVGWHPDPFRRHELRFKDGDLWTEHVSDRGVAGIDTTPVASLPRSRPPDRTAGAESPPVDPGSPVRVLPETTRGATSLLAALVLVVEEVAVGEQGAAGIDRAIKDEHGHRIGTVRVGREPLGARALRMLTTSAKPEPTEVDVFDLTGALLIGLDRPNRLLKPRILVSGGDGSRVGTIEPERLLHGLRYQLVAGGTVVGTLEGSSPTDREVRVLDPAGTVVARVSTTWEVLADAHHPTADTYLVVFEQLVAEPLHTLALGALLALDSFLVPDPVPAEDG